MLKLSGIEAPKIEQPYDEEAKQVLSKVLHQYVEFELKVDTISNTLEAYVSTRDGWCGSGRADAGLLMVKSGLAWAEKLSQLQQYQQAEKEAQEAKRGLWADHNPIPPSEWGEKNGEN